VEVEMRWMLLVTMALAVGCSGDDDLADDETGAPTEETGDDGTQTGCDVPADGPTEDDVVAGGTSLMCYYPPPEGYCWEDRNGYTVEAVVTNGKGAVGCADGVAVTNGSCPLDLAIGRCDGWGAEQDRVYYECNKFDSIFPDGLDVACEANGGTWTPL
jgi:hypothetical protein